MAMKLREQPGEKMHPSKEEKMHFTFSDTIAGYVTTVDQVRKTFTLKTAGDREFQVKLTNTTYAELVRNLGETFQDPGVPLESLLAPAARVTEDRKHAPGDRYHLAHDLRLCLGLPAHRRRSLPGSRGKGHGVPARAHARH